jgi:hypothetical protein
VSPYNYTSRLPVQNDKFGLHHHLVRIAGNLPQQLVYISGLNHRVPPNLILLKPIEIFSLHFMELWLIYENSGKNQKGCKPI